MKKGLTMLVAAMVITGLVCVIGSAAAANYVWVEKDIKGVGHLTSEYEVDTEYGIANGIEMEEITAGTGIVSRKKWTLELNPQIDGECVEGMIEEKTFDVEYFPITYQNHSYDQKWLEKKCVKNYDIGVVVDANFMQLESLMLKETIVTYGDGVVSSTNILGQGLEMSMMQTISADVLGISHIGFKAMDVDNHHHTIAYGREETIGQFQIDSTIEIGLTCGDEGLGDWLGCP